MEYNKFLYWAVSFLSCFYIVIASIFCIIWASNYPMEKNVQYVFPNTDVQGFAFKLKDITAESTDVEIVSKGDDFLKWNQYSLYDEMLVSFIRFKGTDDILCIDALQHHNDVILRIVADWQLDEKDSLRINKYRNIPLLDFSFRDASCFRHSLKLQKSLEQLVLNKIGNYHKNGGYLFICVVVNFYNHHFPVLLFFYLLSVILLYWSLRKMPQRWKIISFLFLALVPFIIVFISAISQSSCLSKNIVSVKSRRIFEGNAKLNQLTFLIVHNNDVSSFIDENPEIDINCSDTVYGNSLLMFSIIHKSYKSAKGLLEHQANPNYTSPNNGGTPLLKSLQVFDSSGNPDTSFLSMVMSYGANANLVTYDKNNERKRVPLLEVRDLEQARMLVEKGGAQVSKEIIDILEQDQIFYPLMNDSIHNQIVTYYQSLLSNDEE